MMIIKLQFLWMQVKTAAVNQTKNSTVPKLTMQTLLRDKMECAKAFLNTMMPS